MYRLYCRKGAGSAAIEAVLALCEVAYETIDLERNPDGTLPAYFHDINPRAEVPTLLLPDGSVMTESAAILIHLADAHPAARLAPAIDDPLRPRYLRWMVYLATTIYMSDLRYYYPQKYTQDREGLVEIKACAADGMLAEFAIFANALDVGPYLLGPRLTAVDIYAAMLVSWAPDVAALFACHPNLKAMCDGVVENPVVAAVWQRNGM